MNNVDPTNGFFDGQNDDEKILDSIGLILPAGDYLTVVRSLTKEQAQNNPNTLMFKVEIEVIQGKFMGRKIWENFIYQHEKKITVDIGRARMKQLCMSIVGTPGIGSPDQLYNQPFTTRLGNKTKAGIVTESFVEKTGPKEGIPAKRGAPNNSAQVQAGAMAPHQPGANNGVPF